MKIIALWDNYQEEKTPISVADKEPLAQCWLTDSCLLREGRPLYLPDWDSDIRLYPTLAVRIDRLGKGIQRRFAHRYWSQVSLWLSVRACTQAARLSAQGLPLASAIAYDNSLVVAPFFDVESQTAARLQAHIALMPGTADADSDSAHDDYSLQRIDWDSARLALQIDEAIEQVSHHTTLKTGDILLMGFTPQGLSVCEGMSVEIKIDNYRPSTLHPTGLLHTLKIK